ncbi:hypothetical protein [Streptomyces sp. W4I9-2]|nr:hypothetical protein [Streptomyces sp. W4I9-2]MDQ0700890.1 hypothetical protein [Streptomyces sp. W4I9-2]
MARGAREKWAVEQLGALHADQREHDVLDEDVALRRRGASAPAQPGGG